MSIDGTLYAIANDVPCCIPGVVLCKKRAILAVVVACGMLHAYASTMPGMRFGMKFANARRVPFPFFDLGMKIAVPISYETKFISKSNRKSYEPRH